MEASIYILITVLQGLISLDNRVKNTRAAVVIYRRWWPCMIKNNLTPLLGTHIGSPHI